MVYFSWLGFNIHTYSFWCIVFIHLLNTHMCACVFVYTYVYIYICTHHVYYNECVSQLKQMVATKINWILIKGYGVCVRDDEMDMLTIVHCECTHCH